jgi:phage portal protein BeeE
MRMDTAALYKSNSDAVGGGWMKPDEARYRANFEPVPGGSSPYLQQQNYSLEALAKRDAQADLWSKPVAAPPPAAKPPEETPPDEKPPSKDLDEDEMAALFTSELTKEAA